MFAIQHKEWHTVSWIMNELASEYFEGYMENSLIIFKRTLRVLPNVALLKVKEYAVFDRVKEMVDEVIDYTVERAENIDNNG